MFSEGELELLQKIISQGLLQALGETLLMTFVPTILAFVIGLPLGVLLVTGDENGIHPLPRWFMTLLNTLISARVLAGVMLSGVTPVFSWAPTPSFMVILSPVSAIFSPSQRYSTLVTAAM